MIKDNIPFNSTPKTVRRLAANLWYWYERFLLKQTTEDGSFDYYVFNKYEDGQGKDLCWKSKSLKSIKEMFDIMNEDIPREIVTELIPSND